MRGPGPSRQRSTSVRPDHELDVNPEGDELHEKNRDEEGEDEDEALERG